MTVLRVATLNLAIHVRFDTRLAEIVAWLERVDPDVLMLQEVSFTDDGSWAGTIANEIGYSAVTAAGRMNTPWELVFGNAILSRWPISEHRSLPLPFGVPQAFAGLGSDPIGPDALFARTAGLDVVCVHLEPQPALSRILEQQVVLIERTLRTLRNASSPLPALIGGDFNCRPESSSIRYLSGLCSLDGDSTYYQDAFAIAGTGPGYTLDVANPLAARIMVPSQRIDYLFVGENFAFNDFAGGPGGGTGKVVAAELFAQQPITGKLFASDHFGVFADIAWPKRDDDLRAAGVH